MQISDNLNHTLEVALSDVCGDVVANGMFFGSWGWVLNPKYNPPQELIEDVLALTPVADPLVPGKTTQYMEASKANSNSAHAPAPMSFVATAAALAGALLMLMVS